MTLIKYASDIPIIEAEANWSRWIARCPACPSALQLVPGTLAFACWDCGARAEVRWPDADMIAGVERLLSMRPNVTTRNWLPGETLIDLMMENGKGGIFDDLPPELGTGSLFSVDGGRILRDQLPELEPRLILRELAS